jgi:Lrp/AsnC family transcriptional regulator of ectoine degradation|tara:strand:+ start:154 stop:627 length:474 start_codon:yes stop_codon:yes gene_type:complete
MSLLKLDAIDIHILATVQEYGRMSKTALAEKVNLSATPCWTRLNRLENAGIIRGYHAEIAFELIAKMTTVILEISLKRHRHEDFEIFEKRINELDEIVECIATGGGVDYILKMVVPSIDEYQKLVDALLLENLGIDRYFTYIVTREIKSSKPKLTTI